MRTAAHFGILLTIALACLGCRGAPSDRVSGVGARTSPGAPAAEQGSERGAPLARPAEQGASLMDPTKPIPWRDGSAPVVLVELFSSEGCSSCPPADRLLKEIVEQQPIEGARVVALEMHVDYWNDLGWEDPFSSAAFSARQRAYAAALGERGVYTPQAIVDGRVGLVGSDKQGLREAITGARDHARARVTLSRSPEEEERTVALDILVSSVPVASGEVLLAVTESGLATRVERGENAGSLLAHAPVVRSLRRLGAASGAGPTTFDHVTIALPAAWSADRLSAVAFVQDPATRFVVGASALAL